MYIYIYTHTYIYPLACSMYVSACPYIYVLQCAHKARNKDVLQFGKEQNTLLVFLSVAWYIGRVLGWHRSRQAKAPFVCYNKKNIWNKKHMHFKKRVLSDKDIKTCTCAHV
jgi:hypothetical protein